MAETPGKEKVSGTFCAKHSPGRSGKRYLTPFPDSTAAEIAGEEGGATSDADRVSVLGPLGEWRAMVADDAPAWHPQTGLGAAHLAARYAHAAGFPVRDADGRPMRYAVRWRGADVVQVLPRLVAAASPRLRRLMADFELIQNEFTGHPRIDVQPAGGFPPEKYIITYRLKGVKALDRSQMPIISEHHVAEIYLHRGYPREKPKCVLRTPIFHPNFGSYICIADHWAPGETLVDIIVHIGRMIQYQSYNPDSPLDGIAARWARRHEYLFPVGREPLYQPEVDIRLGGGEVPARDGDTIPLAPQQDQEPPEGDFIKLWPE